MYVDGTTILEIATILSALGVIVGIIVAVHEFVERDKRQTAKIKAIQSEQTLICYGVMACLKGLKEQGCNGPVTEALNRMEKHLNLSAHEDN